MNPHDIGDADDGRVERLLRMRFSAQRPAECPDMESVALVLSGAAEPDELRRAVGHVAGCSKCSAAILVLGSLRTERGASASSRRPRTSRRSIRVLLVAAVVLACAAVVTVLALQGDRQGNPPPVRDGQLVPKGQTDGLAVAVQRGTSRFRAITGPG